MRALLARPTSRRQTASGFTLVELMVTLVVFALVIGAVTAVILSSARSKQRTSQHLETAQTARAAVDMIARDIRCAGFGADEDAPTPQPAIAYVDSEQIILSENLNPYPENPLGPVAPLAYNPAGAPNPQPLVASAWTPPAQFAGSARYRTGAELVRYTLDVNNDGVVDASDIAAPQGADAAATPNPNDYVLVRQVYGDSTGNVALNNGGAQDRVALIRTPNDTGVPPIFTVFFRNIATPWDWSNGPVPASRLKDIQRVEVQVTAASARPDARGQFAQTTITTDVNSMRSVPDFGATTYVIDGSVFNDADQDHSFSAGDQMLAGATLRLGNSFVSYTSSTGYFAFHAPPGTYTLKQTPPAGYGIETSPDSFIVNITSSGSTYTFADTARRGGYVRIHAFNDLNGNGSSDTGEGPLQGISFSIAPDASPTTPKVTDVNGDVQIFASAANYVVTCNPPDSMAVTTTNPQPGTMPNGGSVSYTFGLKQQQVGYVKGRVFRDTNRDGSQQGSELGAQNVWVGVTKNGTVVDGYAYTDVNGDYSITVPINNPPHTSPYWVYMVPPQNFFPTTPAAIGNIWVTNGNTAAGNNFGVAGFTYITLTANRVLSLATADLIEKDWNGSHTENARGDKDLILGADAGGTDNISVWYNQYNAATLFNSTPDKTFLAPNSVMTMALDTLDRNDNIARPDLVTGTKYTPGGNFFVWFTQGSSNNEGIFPTNYSTGQNYLTSDNGDVTGVVTLDCAGGSSPDIVVGTKSATAGQGQIEVWQSNDATTPTFTRVETINNLSGWLIGEITGMMLADINNDGRKDLIITTRTSNYNGQMIVFQNVSKLTGARFVYRYACSFGGNAPTTVAVTDADGDGWNDIFVGTQMSTSQGMVFQFRNTGATTPFSFSINRAINAPGIVTSLCAADFGATSARNDLALGFRSSDVGFGGGVRIYFLDSGFIPDTGVDPSPASSPLVNFVPALVSANFNYGVQPSAPTPPYLNDLAVGVKASATTGALWVFFR